MTATNARRLCRRLLFVAGVASVLVIWSEKAFWYVQGWEFAELVAVYALPTASLLWTVDHYRAAGWRAAILAGALFAFLLEGVITPILYEDGPFPFLPAYFAGWHGIGSVVLLWYGVRRFLLTGRTWRLAAVASLCGLVFGLWSLMYWLPESATDPDLADQGFVVGRWPLGRFALYAVALGLALAAAHLLLDRVWQRRFPPSRLEVAVVLLGLAVFAAPTLIAIPWAPLKLGALLGLVLYGLRRRAQPDGKSLLEEIGGRFPAVRVWPLAFLPATAVAAYGTASIVEPSNQTIRAVTQGISVGVGVVGAVALSVALWPWRRRAQ